MTVKELREWLERLPDENTVQMRDDTGDWSWCVDVETLGQYVYISGTNKDIFISVCNSENEAEK